MWKDSFSQYSNPEIRKNHSNPDSNILFFAIFESGKIVFRNSITLPVSYEYIPTAKMIVNTVFEKLHPELKIKGVRCFRN